MSTYQDEMNRCLTEGWFSYITIVAPDNSIFYTNNANWANDPTTIMAAWSNAAEPSVTVGGTRFSKISSDYPEVLIGKNVAGGGTLIIRRAPNGYWFVTWTDPAKGMPDLNVQTEVARVAMAFK